jgi:hypothetical protein
MIFLSCLWLVSSESLKEQTQTVVFMLASQRWEQSLIAYILARTQNRSYFKTTVFRMLAFSSREHH